LNTPFQVSTVFFMIVLSVLLFACSTPTASKWGPQHVTPGARLTLQEVRRTTIQDMSAVTYRVRVSGVPQGPSLSLWASKLKSDPVPVAHLAFFVDEAGRLLVQGPPIEIAMPAGSSINLPEHGKEFVFNAIGFARGEMFEVGLMDSRLQILAFARVIPFPIEVRGEGGCRLWVELASYGGDLFNIRGEGFESNEKLITESRRGGEIKREDRRATADGRFSSTVMPAVLGLATGRAAYNVVSQFCNLTVHYNWGTDAMRVAQD